MQRIALAEQHAHFGGAPGAHHDRGRCRQAHRAGAGNDQHRYTGHQRQTQRRIRPKRQPDQNCQRCHPYDNWYEHGGDFVHQSLDWQFRPLRLFDHLDDLRQHGVVAHLCGAIGQRAGTVHRAADNACTDGLFHRNRLPGDHAFIDVGHPGQNLAIHRNLFAGAHLDHIPWHNLFDCQFNDLTTPLDPCGLGLQADKFTYRLASAPFGAGFQETPQQDQHNDDGGGLEIDVHRPCRQ